MADEVTKHYMRPEGKGIKLHLGCGDYWFEGYLNIDVEIYGGTDMLHDIREKFPFQDGVVEVIEMYEVLEHLNRNEADTVLTEFQRLLLPGGRVRLSVPDISALVGEFNESDSEERKQKIIEYIYGFGGKQGHKWGYTKQMLVDLFDKHKFREIKVEATRLPERPDEDKLILECVK